MPPCWTTSSHQLAPTGDPVAGAVLVRVLAVAQDLGPLERQVDRGRQHLVLGAAVEPGNDGRVVGRGVGEGRPGQPAPGGVGEGAVACSSSSTTP